MRTRRLPAKALFPVLIALVVGAAADAAGPGTSGTGDVSCCLLNSSLAQKIQPAASGDEQFFSTQTTDAPGVMVLLDNSTSMLEFQLALAAYPNHSFATSGATAAATGSGQTPPATQQTRVLATANSADAASCRANVYLENLRDASNAAYSDGTAYPQYDPAFNNFFVRNNYYKYMEWTASSPGGNGSSASACSAMNSLPGSGTTSTAGTLLSRMSEVERCQMCLDIAGYYIKPGTTAGGGNDTSQLNKIIFKGNFLNFFPPKMVVARKILTDFVSSQVTTRVAVSTFNNSNLNSPNASSSGGSSLQTYDGAALISAFLPTCPAAGTPAPAWTTSQQNSVNALIRNISFGSTGGPIATPLAEALFNVGQFMTGDPSNTFYRNLTSGPSNNWVNGAFTPPSRGTGSTGAFCSACQENSIVVITDGSPLGDNNLPKTKMQTLNGGAVVCPGTGCDTDDYNGTPNLMADVAKMLATQDLFPSTAPSPLANQQSVHTYVIGLGVDVPLLAATAIAGQGAYYRVNNATQLNDAINAVVVDVQNRATAFSSSAIQTVQVGSGASAYVPRFNPGSTAIWEGHLFRFNIFNEFTANVDKNGDGKTDGVFLVDSDNDVIVENATGQFVKQVTNLPARPIWDAGALLQARDTTTRNIYTALPVVDVSGNITGWTRTAFTSDSGTATTLVPYLGITGNNVCSTLGTLLPGSPTLTTVQCAQKIIDYIRGIDIFTSGTPNRAAVLGDIFHSAPVVVEPPIDQGVCNGGLSSQCVKTLYGFDSPFSTAAATPTTSYTGGLTSYEKYFQDNQSRQKVVLVGANDGMLHAFDAGSPTTSPPTRDTTLPQPLRSNLYTAGSGAELWAFITPDQLPRLQNMVVGGTHQLSMDGEIMVRDIWVDGSGASNTPNQKESDEFHTIAIAHEREGGTHSIAFDLSDPTSPQMKWIWPLPCSPEEQSWGQSWGQFTPKPPPIGPVLLQKTGGITRYGVATEERYVAVLNGGHDPYNGRGRAVAMLDAWTGVPLYKAAYIAGDTTPAAEMKYSFAATVGLIDFSEAGASYSPDGFFDTGIVGDEGGQVWTFRFAAPGHINSSTNLVDNWTFARGYEPNTSTTKTATERLPIFTLVASAIDESTNWLRTYVGSGDKTYMKSTSGGDCRPDDLSVCVEEGCAVSATTTLVNGRSRFVSTFSGAAGAFTAPTAVASTDATTAGNAACTNGSAQVTMAVTGCTSGGTAVPVGPTETLTQTCSGTAPYACTQTTSNTGANVSRGANTSTGSGKSTFASFVVLKTSHTLDLPADASTYDGARVQRSGLVDVSATVASTGTVSGSVATNQSPGWFLTYPNTDEKTGTSPTLLAGCLVWSTLLPGVSSCSSAGTLTTNNYQADFITGAPNCAEAFTNVATGGSGAGWVRSFGRAAIAPPAERTPSVEIGPGGSSLRVSLTGVSPSQAAAGGTAADSSHDAIATTPDLMQVQYSLPLTLEQHNCRHVSNASCP